MDLPYTADEWEGWMDDSRSKRLGVSLCIGLIGMVLTLSGIKNKDFREDLYAGAPAVVLSFLGVKYRK